MKPFFAPLLEPLGAVWFLMALGVLILLWRRQWRIALWLLAPTFLLFLLGSTPLAEMLVGAAERPYATRNIAVLTPADAAIVLGGTQRLSAHDIFGFAIASAEERVLTGAELMRLGKARTLVLGGSTQSVPGEPGVPTMTLIRNWLVASGLTTAGVTNLGLCANTHEEAIQFSKMKRLKDWRKVVLVTSALHLRRAEAAFRKQGVEAQIVACDFQVYGVPGTGRFSSLFPSQHRLDLLSLYLHEKIGWWVYKWRGWI
jgi:uncharacterized SAM-binding protein YcdF (DUF218 family)